MLGELGGLLGSMTGKVFDPLFVVFAIGFIALGITGRPWLSLVFAVIGAALNVAWLFSWWREIGFTSQDILSISFRLVVVWLIWALLLAFLSYWISTLIRRRDN